MATTREQRAKRVLRLRAEGLKIREITARTGWARSTVSELINDPDGSGVRARKDSYRGVCQSCGGPTDGSNGLGQAPRSCKDCLEWSDEGIIEAIRQWAADHDGQPPLASDWRKSGFSHPCGDIVTKRLGWANALIMAGFEPRVDFRPETQAEVERLIREGLTVQEVAGRFGWTHGNVAGRLYRRGLTVRGLRRAA